MGRYSDDYWRPYVPVAERRRKALKKIEKLKKKGRAITPIEISGRKIASTFWGQAWCDNLEAYSDYDNRLPRGRTYVRNGSVIDLRIEAGQVHALVSGSDIYEVEITIKPLPPKQWAAIKKQCSGHIDSLVELLKGAISKSVMEIVTRKGEGLFPTPKEIRFECSCPDWASMCKHVAAVLYGVGARLDQNPSLLFALRQVDPTEMVAAALDVTTPVGQGRVLESDALSDLFGVEIDMGDADVTETPAKTRPRAAAGVKKAATKAAKPKRVPKVAAEKPVDSVSSPRKKTSKTPTVKPTERKTAVKAALTEKARPKKKTTRKSEPPPTVEEKKKTAPKPTVKKSTDKKTPPKKKPAPKKSPK